MKKLLIISLVVLIFILLYKKKKVIKSIYLEEEKYKIYYPNIILKNFFSKISEEGYLMDNSDSPLNFGYICPGAISTINYLEEIKNNYNKINIKVVENINKIKDLTDFQFFIEIIAIYNQYLDKDIYYKIKNKLEGNECKLSKLITSEITRLFNSLPKNIRKNIPDNFYHVRHNTLICSNDKNLALERIKLIKNIYKNNKNNKNHKNDNNNKDNRKDYGKDEGKDEGKENFKNIDICEGKRDGVSGCRDCCSIFQGNDYLNCVNNCMN